MTATTDSTQPSPNTDERSVPDAGKTPVNSASLALWGLLLSLALTALGGFLIFEALSAAGAISANSQLKRLATNLDGTRPNGSWAIPVGIVCALLGLWLLMRALRPRAHKAVRLNSETGIFLTNGALARIAKDAADDVGGVLDAHTSATARKVKVTVTTTGAASIAEDVRAAINERFSALADKPSISVSTKRAKS